MKNLFALLAIAFAFTASAADHPAAATSVIVKYSGPTKQFGRFGSITTNDVIELTRTEANGVVSDSNFSVVKVNGVGPSVLATTLEYTGGTNVIVDLSANTLFSLTLTNTAYIILTNATANEANFTLFLKQDATGARSVTWDGYFKWPANTAPTITTNAARMDMIRVFKSPFSTNVFAQAVQNYQ